MVLVGGGEVSSRRSRLEVVADILTEAPYGVNLNFLRFHRRNFGKRSEVKEILVDCEQEGNVCHTGRETCFHNKLKGARCLKTPRQVNKRIVKLDHNRLRLSFLD